MSHISLFRVSRCIFFFFVEKSEKYINRDIDHSSMYSNSACWVILLAFFFRKNWYISRSVVCLSVRMYMLMCMWFLVIVSPRSNFKLCSCIGHMM